MNLDTCSVTVTYRPDLALLKEQIVSMLDQCRILVVDNSDDGAVIKAVGTLCRELGVDVLQMERNLGIGAAQNRGVAYLKEQMPDIKFVLFLDQDSVPDAGFVNTLKSEFMTAGIHSRVAVIGPALFDPRAGAYHSFHKLEGLRYRKINPQDSGSQPLRCTTVNSSGSLVSLQVFEEIGAFDESLFIDHVETEWCFRATSKGFALFVTNKTQLKHLMGDDVLAVSVFGWKKFMPYRSPLRHQYLFRNSVILLGRDYVPVAWKLYCVLKLLMSLMVFALFSKEKSKQLKSMTAGVRAGLNGQGGCVK